jgi:hypothetical protein
MGGKMGSVSDAQSFHESSLTHGPENSARMCCTATYCEATDSRCQ